MAKFIEIIPILCLAGVTAFAQFGLAPYLIGQGLIPKETAVVSMFGTAALQWSLQ